jgi:hypothetical protein
MRNFNKTIIILAYSFVILCHLNAVYTTLYSFIKTNKKLEPLQQYLRKEQKKK